MTAEEHLKLLRALCKKLEPELNYLTGRLEDHHPGEAATLACKLYDAIMDPEEAKP